VRSFTHMKKNNKKKVSYVKGLNRMPEDWAIELANLLPDALLRKLARELKVPIKKLKADTALGVALALREMKATVKIEVG